MLKIKNMLSCLAYIWLAEKENKENEIWILNLHVLSNVFKWQYIVIKINIWIELSYVEPGGFILLNSWKSKPLRIWQVNVLPFAMCDWNDELFFLNH